MPNNPLEKKCCEKCEFMECDTCRVKPGSPYLCNGCLHNRDLIQKLCPNQTGSVYEKIKKQTDEFVATWGKETERVLDEEPRPTPEWEKEFKNSDIWERINADGTMSFYPEKLKSFINSLLSSEREKVRGMVWKIIKKWNNDGQSFTKDVLADLKELMGNLTQ